MYHVYAASNFLEISNAVPVIILNNLNKLRQPVFIDHPIVALSWQWSVGVLRRCL